MIERTVEGSSPSPAGGCGREWAGEGPGVVLAHAGIADARQWDPQWDALVRRPPRRPLRPARLRPAEVETTVLEPRRPGRGDGRGGPRAGGARRAARGRGRSSSTPRSSSRTGCRAWSGSAAGSAAPSWRARPRSEAAFERERGARGGQGLGGRRRPRRRDLGRRLRPAGRPGAGGRPRARPDDGLRDVRAGEARTATRSCSTRPRPGGSASSGAGARRSWACSTSPRRSGRRRAAGGAGAGRAPDRPPRRRAHAQPRAARVVHRDAARVPRRGRGGRSRAQGVEVAPGRRRGRWRTGRAAAPRGPGAYCGYFARSAATAAACSATSRARLEHARRSRRAGPSRAGVQSSSQRSTRSVACGQDEQVAHPREVERIGARASASRRGACTARRPRVVVRDEHEADGDEARTAVGRGGRERRGTRGGDERALRGGRGAGRLGISVQYRALDSPRPCRRPATRRRHAALHRAAGDPRPGDRGPRRDRRGARRPAGRRGADGDPRRRPGPGADRRRGHDADPGHEAELAVGLPAHRGAASTTRRRSRR